MRIGIIGCGGIGGVLAATLTRAGADVTPIVGNPKIAQALATHGYRVRELDGTEWSQPCAAPSGPFPPISCWPRRKDLPTWR